MAKKKTVILVAGATDEQLKSFAELLGDDFDVAVVDIDKFKSENKKLSDSVKEKDLLIKDAMKKIKDLEANTPDDKTEEIAELNKTIKEKELEISEKDGMIKDLMEAQDGIEEERKSGIPTIKHGKDKYQVLIPSFNYKGKTYSVEDLRKDKALVKELVEMKSGVLKKID